VISPGETPSSANLADALIPDANKSLVPQDFLQGQFYMGTELGL
jgi:hypothetical protein